MNALWRTHCRLGDGEYDPVVYVWLDRLVLILKQDTNMIPIVVNPQLNQKEQICGPSSPRPNSSMDANVPRDIHKNMKLPSWLHRLCVSKKNCLVFAKNTIRTDTKGWLTVCCAESYQPKHASWPFSKLAATLVFLFQTQAWTPADWQSHAYQRPHHWQF